MGVFRAIEDYIRGITDSARRSPSLEDFLRNLIPIISEALETDAVSIFLADRVQGTLYLAATTGALDKQYHKLVSYRFGEGLTGQIAQNRLPFSKILDNTGSILQDTQMEAVKGVPTFFLGAPLLWLDNQVFGVIRCIYTRHINDAHKSDFLETLTVITSLITPYIVAVRSDEERFNSVERITHELKSSLVAIKNTTLLVNDSEQTLSNESRHRLSDIVSFCDMLLISIESKSLATRKPLNIETIPSLFYSEILLPVVRMLEPVFRNRSLTFQVLAGC